MRPPGRLGGVLRLGKTPEIPNDGSPTWSADGMSPLYSKYLSKEPCGDTYRWQLVRWQTPRDQRA
jgi:hypothetical protein